MPPLTFRTAAADDIERLWALRTEAARVQCAGYYPAEALETWLAAPPSAAFRQYVSRGHAIVGERTGNLVGYTVIDAPGRELEALFVAPSAFRQGYGARLLQRAEHLAATLGIESLTLSAALNAIDFYRAHDYVLITTDTIKHRSGVTLERGVMRKTLTPTSSS
ncbi:GNAT family N-acetyltransferase [Salinicola aestuarinus]|uniref:GNAT family N-acetyltransferase n=1 Tax=Salinicola aestuarinus TaxID=1949082 RepID=UPI001300271F|nr:GNAT family N-acetyltransferase [Salinicola aestuarinus]